MAVQQRKVSKMKVRQRKAANQPTAPQPGICPNCEHPRVPHRVCANCGYYNGRQVLSVTSE